MALRITSASKKNQKKGRRRKAEGRSIRRKENPKVNKVTSLI
jgi:hypothetical protein